MHEDRAHVGVENQGMQKVEAHICNSATDFFFPIAKVFVN